MTASSYSACNLTPSGQDIWTSEASSTARFDLYLIFEVVELGQEVYKMSPKH